jgi:radical SAM superfamily enzyme YgiQ (UPF0313 family)
MFLPLAAAAGIPEKTMNILLVYPRNPSTFWSFEHVLKFVSKKSAFPPLGLLTVAAMLPPEWHLRLIDLNVQSLQDTDLGWADYVFLSGMIVHKESAHEIAARCAAFGKTIVAGGPLFTSGHAEFPEISHFVLGEAEDLIESLIADIERGELQSLYQSKDWPELARTPVPRWDLINLRDYVAMLVQFSRGCPFDCEFCDIVVMNGRVPRTKNPGQIVRELEALCERGWKDMVFFVDDNFIGNRKRTKEMLRVLIAWIGRSKSKIGFLTEASVNLADDQELCELMVQAGFKKVFVGIETPAAESLEECNKRQNCNRSLGDAISTLQHRGMEVMGGFVIGFDNDPKDIFQRQFEFIQKSGVVTAMVGLLTALPQTALYRRLTKEGRILSATSGNNTGVAINFVTRLDSDFLQRGYRELMRRLYEPQNYYRRIATFLRSYQPKGPSSRLSGADVKAFLRSLWVLGAWDRGRTLFWRLLLTTLLASPDKFRTAMELSIMGRHFRLVARNL